MKHLSVAILVAVLIVLTLAPRSAAQGQASGEQRWTNVVYLGGAIGIVGKSLTWNNALSVSPTAIRLELVGGVAIAIDPARVTALTYAGTSYKKKWDEMIGVFFFPVAAPMIVAQHKRRDHFVTIDYTLEDGRPSGVLLQLHKDNVVAILEALEHATGTRRRR